MHVCGVRLVLVETDDARAAPRRAAKAMQALGSGRREGALAKAALDRGAVAWSTVTALLILVANLMQHVLHPPLSECEDAIREAGGAWDPTAPFVFSETWTPEHELRVQWKVGKWAYLTSQVLALQAIYHVASLTCELRGRPRGAALTRVVYGGAAVIGGFGALVFVLYAFFWVLQHSHPEWRAQWNFFEDRGYAPKSKVKVRGLGESAAPQATRGRTIRPGECDTFASNDALVQSLINDVFPVGLVDLLECHDLFP